MDIDFPFRIAGDGRTTLSPSTAKHVRDMIELVLFTRPGERVMRSDFGTGLLQHVFGGNGPQIAATLQVIVQAALAQALGDAIDLRSVTVQSNDAQLTATVVYALRTSGDVFSDTFVQSTT
jgi:phage baseplate assembly protein W